MLCRGLCAGSRACGIVCGHCSGQRSLSELGVLLDKFSWEEAGVVEVGLMLRRERTQKST